MKDYETELDAITSWLWEYKSAGATGKQAHYAIARFKKLAKTSKAKLDTKGWISYMQDVQEALAYLFDQADDFPKFSGAAWLENEPETRLSVMRTVEYQRLDSIMDLGYRPIFDKFDANPARKEFLAFVHKPSFYTIEKLYRATKFLLNAIDVAKEAPVCVLDLYIRMRELESGKPFWLFVDSETGTLSDSFQHNTDMMSRHLSKLKSVEVALQKVLSHYGIKKTLMPTPERNCALNKYEEVIESLIEALCEVYVDLKYAKIMQMV